MGITSHPGGPICRCAMCINAAGVATTVSKSPGLGIRSFAQIAQIKWATVSDSLRTNERLWANPSGRSCQKSDLLRSLMINKRMSDSLKKIWLNCKIVFLVRFLYFFYERFAHSLFFNEWCERFAQVAHQKWAKSQPCKRRSGVMEGGEGAE